MSRHFGSAIVFMFLLAIGFAANNASDFADTPARTRGPAADASASGTSAMARKEAILGQGAPVVGPSHTEKLRGPVTAKISLIGAKPVNAGDLFTLQGEISADENLTAVHYKWAIPAGIELVSGQPSGVIQNLSAATKNVFQITLRKGAAGNAQVHLLAGAAAGIRRFADSAQYNTEMQDAIDAVKAAAKEKSEHADTGVENGGLTVYH